MAFGVIGSFCILQGSARVMQSFWEILGDSESGPCNCTCKVTHSVSAGRPFNSGGKGGCLRSSRPLELALTSQVSYSTSGTGNGLLLKPLKFLLPLFVIFLKKFSSTQVNSNGIITVRQFNPLSTLILTPDFKAAFRFLEILIFFLFV